MSNYTNKLLRAKLGTFLCLLWAFLFASCGAYHHIPKEETIVTYKDSTIYNIIDSVRITEATHYKEMAWLGDTIRIRGAHSSAYAYNDTTREMLVAGLNEDKVEEKTKIIFKDKIQYRDSLVKVEVPVEVEKIREVVPRWSWFSLGGNVLFCFLLFLFIFFKFKNRPWNFK